MYANNLKKQEKKFSNKKLFSFFLFSLTFLTGVHAQNTITGKVTEVSSVMGLPGVSVLIKDSKTSVTTDFEGNYIIQVPSTESILIFSYIGFRSVEVTVGSQTKIDAVLSEDISKLDEIIVVGYGTQSKRNVTGAISSVNMDAANKNLPNISVTQSLTGVSGVQFIGDGRPGQAGSILIRGQNSLSGDNEPLIVLDGIIFNGNLNAINPQDIETIDVLKDASSAAIYGSRAANGVILITSKKGSTSKPSVNVNVFTGISEPSNVIKNLGPEEYVERKLEWRKQMGLEADRNKIGQYLSATESQNYLNGKTTDAWDLILKSGFTRSIDLNISGRTELVNYYLSSSFSDDKGLILNDQEKRYTFRSNLEFKLADWIKVGVNAMFSQRDGSGRAALLKNAYWGSPYGTYFNEDGSPTQYPVLSEQANVNPLWESNLTSNEDISDNLFSNFYTELNSKLFGGTISYRLNFSPNLRWDHEYNYVRQDLNINFNNTNAEKFNRSSYDWLFENIVTYKKKFGSEHNFDLTLLYSRTHTDYETTTARADQLSVDGLGYNNLSLGSILTNNSYAEETEGISYMSRLNYQFKNRYLFTLTARRDGSSVFSTNNKYTVFPSAAFAWILSDESFFKENSTINLLKVRLSYGAVGNQAISPYQSLSLSDTKRYVFGDGGISNIGVVTSSLGNNDLKWETTYTANAALDFKMFNSRIGGTVELYNSKTEDLLVRRSIPVMGGYKSILTNIGEVNNKGIEVLLNTTNIKTDKFEWSSSLNFSYNSNKIVKLFGTDLNNDGKEDDSVANSWFIGKPINSFYDYKFNGIYQEGDQDIPNGSKPGFVRVKDINGDGKITPDDRTVVGSGNNPEYVLGLRNQFRYGNLSLSIFVNSLLGWEAPFNLFKPGSVDRAFNTLDAGYWTPENRSNSRPGLTYTDPLKTNFYQSRNFFRIRDVSLGYEFDKESIQKIKLSSLRLSISAKNLYTFTNWLGSDPENGTGSKTDAIDDNNAYPMPRTIALGLNIGF
ncbi:SusC/RagA family TonB-linked outer membrane protein [Flavobacterium weaverense]|uniref:TonB-linked SusC/RagA family outer membrane protein n=2 Tax=Flavobacterium weaverense TaxID=271156 RepID=A0A3L9ZRS8_9FLAO|nr:TonB-dependent receptor [Flavobacterium weaverense]RMA73128.1 TonB-linked SusC/RagA family outer membrane protein [Flavobacterium weaverense]